MPKFSVIIPTYNRAVYVAQAIDSVLAQTFTDYEIIVCDDGSTDATEDVLRSYGDRIKIVHTKHAGPGGARNAGAKIASGDYLSFLDSDDLWRPQTLELVSKVCDQDKTICAVYLAETRFRGASSVPIDDYRGEPSVVIYTDVLSGLPGAPPAATSLLGAVSRELYWGVGGLCEDMRNWEDVDFALRIGDGNRIGHITEPKCVWCRTHDGNTSDVGAILHTCTRELLRREAKGVYPGGEARRRDRERWLVNIASYAAGTVARNRHPILAMGLYMRTLRLLVSHRRYRSLAYLPAVTAWYYLGLRKARTSAYSRSESSSIAQTSKGGGNE